MQLLIKWSGRIALLLGLLTLAFLLLQGPAYQAGWFDLGQVFFKHFRVIVVAGAIAALSGLIALIAVKVGWFEGCDVWVCRLVGGWLLSSGATGDQK